MCSPLNICQSPEELNEIYQERDYYWYLRSVQFREAFLKPLAAIVNELGLPVLDVACGEGQLAEFIEGDYLGFDGSAAAIAKAKERFPDKKFEVRRFEGKPPEGYSVVVFGGVLSVLIKPEERVNFIRGYNPEFFVVYDLETLDTTEIDEAFHRVSITKGTAEILGLQEVKKHRKIILYKGC